VISIYIYQYSLCHICSHTWCVKLDLNQFEQKKISLAAMEIKKFFQKKPSFLHKQYIFDRIPEFCFHIIGKNQKIDWELIKRVISHDTPTKSKTDNSPLAGFESCDNRLIMQNHSAIDTTNLGWLCSLLPFGYFIYCTSQ